MGQAVESAHPDDAEGLRNSGAGTVKTAARVAYPQAPVLETGLTLANGWHRFTTADGRLALSPAPPPTLLRRSCACTRD